MGNPLFQITVGEFALRRIRCVFVAVAVGLRFREAGWHHSRKAPLKSKRLFPIGIPDPIVNPCLCPFCLPHPLAMYRSLLLFLLICDEPKKGPCHNLTGRGFQIDAGCLYSNFR